jgi:predicted ribosomally synthesized peptide with nif11-like leader
MSQGNLEQFYQTIAQDEELQQKLATVSDGDTFAQLIIELGEHKGYSFTKEQVKADIAKIQRQRLGAELWSELPIAAVDQNLAQFYELAAQDQQMLQQLKAVTDSETFAKLVVELGAQKGYKFTEEQVKAATLEAQRKRLEDDWSELSEEELEAVAGGCIRFTKPSCGFGCVFLSVAGGTQCCAW